MMKGKALLGMKAFHKNPYFYNSINVLLALHFRGERELSMSFDDYRDNLK